MKKIFFIISTIFPICIGSVFISSCHCKKKAVEVYFSPDGTVQVSRNFEKEGYSKATVISYELDGCTYMLQLDNEQKLEPANLAAEFKKDKLAVWIKYSPKKNAASVCMAGQIVEISDIQLRK